MRSYGPVALSGQVMLAEIVHCFSQQLKKYDAKIVFAEWDKMQSRAVHIGTGCSSHSWVRRRKLLGSW